MYLSNDVHIYNGKAEEKDEKRKWYWMSNQIVNGETRKSSPHKRERGIREKATCFLETITRTGIANDQDIKILYKINNDIVPNCKRLIISFPFNN